MAVPCVPRLPTENLGDDEMFDILDNFGIIRLIYLNDSIFISLIRGIHAELKKIV